MAAKNEEQKPKVGAARETLASAQQSELSRRESESETGSAKAPASSDASTRDDKNSPAETNVANGTGLGEIRVAAEEVEGDEVPVNAGGDLDFTPREDKKDEQTQVLVIPTDPDLYPVIRVDNDPADNDNAGQEYLEQQRIMEARRQQTFADRDTPVTEREQRRRMNEQG